MLASTGTVTSTRQRAGILLNSPLRAYATVVGSWKTFAASHVASWTGVQSALPENTHLMTLQVRGAETSC